jgi:uncharacterized membrane-anchored protein
MQHDASASELERKAELTWLGSSLDWIREHERLLLAVGVLLQLAVLVTMIVPPLMTLATGEVILLRVVPVDPRDLFRGDFVILSYEISRPDWNPIWGAKDPTWQDWQRLEGKSIYALLEPEADGRHWRPSGYQLEPPQTGKFIRGRVTEYERAQYGIEQYFVQEGKGREYENAVREHKLSAEVVVDANGNAQLKGLLVEL